MYRIIEHPTHCTIEKKFGSKWKVLQKNKQTRTFENKEDCQTFLNKK